MAIQKTTTYGFPAPTFEYGSADGASAAAEFLSSMQAAEGAIVVAINTVSNNLSVEISNRVSADNVLSAAINVVSIAVAALGDANVVSAQLLSVSAVLQAGVNVVSAALVVEIANRISADNLVSNNISVVSAQVVSVSAVLQAGINVVSNALSAEIINRTAAVNAVSQAVSVVSQALSAEIVARVAAVNVVSQALSLVSQALSVVSQAVSVVSAAGVIKAVNTGDQAAIQTSGGVGLSLTGLTISGVSLAPVSYTHLTLPTKRIV